MTSIKRWPYFTQRFFNKKNQGIHILCFSKVTADYLDYHSKCESSKSMWPSWEPGMEEGCICCSYSWSHNFSWLTWFPYSGYSEAFLYFKRKQHNPPNLPARSSGEVLLCNRLGREDVSKPEPCTAIPITNSSFLAAKPSQTSVANLAQQVTEIIKKEMVPILW